MTPDQFSWFMMVVILMAGWLVVAVIIWGFFIARSLRSIAVSLRRLAIRTRR